MKMSYQKLVHKIRKDLAHNSSLQIACLNVLKEVQSKSEDSLRHVTYNNLSDLSGLPCINDNFAHLISYLCGDRIELFNLNMEYISLEDEQFILDDENIRALVSENRIAHPKTGELINDARDNVFIFFSINSKAVE